MIAAGLGVFSSQTMVDLYSAIYDVTDPGDLGDSDLAARQAFVGKDADEQRLHGHPQAARHRQGRIAKRRCKGVRGQQPWSSPTRNSPDAPELISAMLPAATIRRRRAGSRRSMRMDDSDSDRCWRCSRSAHPTSLTSAGRINSFIPPRDSRDKVRSALLVVGLAGLGREWALIRNSIEVRGYGA